MALSHNTLSSIIYTFNFLIWARMASLLQIGFEPLWKKSKVSSLESSCLCFSSGCWKVSVATCGWWKPSFQSVYTWRKGEAQGKGAAEPRTEPTFQWQQILGDEGDCRIAVSAMLSLLNTSVNAELLWAYRPDDPLVFYIVNWEENNILVYVNDSEILGAPKASHIVP